MPLQEVLNKIDSRKYIEEIGDLEGEEEGLEILERWHEGYKPPFGSREPFKHFAGGHGKKQRSYAPNQRAFFDRSSRWGRLPKLSLPERKVSIFSCHIFGEETAEAARLDTLLSTFISGNPWGRSVCLGYNSYAPFIELSADRVSSRPMVQLIRMRRDLKWCRDNPEDGDDRDIRACSRLITINYAIFYIFGF